MTPRERQARKIAYILGKHGHLRWMTGGRHSSATERIILECIPRPRRVKRARAWGLIDKKGKLVRIPPCDKSMIQIGTGERVIPVTITYKVPKKGNPNEC
jgi:hypothetical protein